MQLDKFEFIKKKYCHGASWGIWGEQGNNPPTFNVGDLNILDPQQNPNLLSQLNPDVVFVGLNISRDITDFEPFSNFHSSNTLAKDYKIRSATINTNLWGGYMTDIIKDYPELHGQNVVTYLNENPDVERKNIEIFREELKDLGHLRFDNQSLKPRIIAFGNAVYDILERNLRNEFYINKVTHYAHYISQENYREKVLSLIQEMDGCEKFAKFLDRFDTTS